MPADSRVRTKCIECLLVSLHTLVYQKLKTSLFLVCLSDFLVQMLCLPFQLRGPVRDVALQGYFARVTSVQRCPTYSVWLSAGALLRFLGAAQGGTCRAQQGRRAPA